MYEFKSLLKKIGEVVPDCIISNQDMFNEIEKKYVKRKRELIIRNPKVYYSINTVNEKKYLTGYVYWPMIGKKDKQVKIYIGRLQDFPKGTKDERCKRIAVPKMKVLLKSYLEPE